MRGMRAGPQSRADTMSLRPVSVPVLMGEQPEMGLELNQSAHHCRPMMCRWRLVWVLLGLTSNSKL